MNYTKSGIKLMSTVVLVALMLFFSFSQYGVASVDAKPVEVVSHKSFDQTVNKVKALVSENGMMVMGEINQGKMLSMTGLNIKGISLLVGNPTVGNKVFSVDPAAGLAIPVRLYIFENKANKVIISYYKPSDLLSQYHDPKIEKIGKMLDNKLEKLTTMASK